MPFEEKISKVFKKKSQKIFLFQNDILILSQKLNESDTKLEIKFLQTTKNKEKMETKELLQKTLSKVAGVDVEITFARKNLVTLFWEGRMEEAFDRLQKYFNGILYGYEYDEECDASVCLLNI